MNKEFQNPNTVEQWWALAEKMKRLSAPPDAKVYINRCGNFHVSWETEEERAEALAVLRGFELSNKQRKVARLTKELAAAQEDLDENTTKD
jgi:hypothetical protein